MSYVGRGDLPSLVRGQGASSGLLATLSLPLPACEGLLTQLCERALSPCLTRKRTMRSACRPARLLRSAALAGPLPALSFSPLQAPAHPAL